MKLEIKVRVLTSGCEPVINTAGDWIDLKAAETVEIRGPWAGYLNKGNKQRNVTFSNYLMPLGVAMQLPKGFEAIVDARSSMFKHFSVMLVNSQGVIDNRYCGNNDQWFAQVIAFKDTKIEKNDRICQFRIQLSQIATFWQKLKWLFSNGIKIKYVDNLDNKERGGFGSTGVK